MPSVGKSSWVKSVPNFLSWSRIAMAFLFPFVATELRVPLIILALLSEFFDGYIARKFDAVTRLGTALDPIADKIFVLSTVIVLLLEQRLTLMEFALVAMRDIIVAIGAVLLSLETGGRVIKFMLPKISGKITTTFQFALLISLFMHFGFSDYLLILTAFISCISAVDYIYEMMHRKFDLQNI